jgi:hypothetical protein
MLVLVLVAGIFAALPLTTNAAPIPVPGNPDWDAKYADANVVSPIKSPRDNASGDKIPSNAHSADYPGLYFYWNDKQQGNGVLLVNPEVFDLFVDGQFILTAKNSNNYWGYVITPDEEHLIDGVYAYGVEKQFQVINEKNGKNEKEDLKNINMVFIDGNYKDATLIIEKVWLDEEGLEMAKPVDREATFNTPYVLGENSIGITDYVSAVKGKQITVTENDILGFEAKVKTIRVSLKADGSETITFENQKQYAIIEIVKIWQDKAGREIGQPNDRTAKFNIGTIHKDVIANEYQVKEGTYEITENDMDGFTLFSVVGLDENGKVTVVAGETVTVTFTNEQTTLPYEFDITVYHRVVENGNYLVYPGVGETFNSREEAYVEWLNNVEGFTFLNLYLAAIRTNDPADMASVEGYICVNVEKNDPFDSSFDLMQNGNGEDVTALIIPNGEGHYVITFWYTAKDEPLTVEEQAYLKYRAYVQLWNDFYHGGRDGATENVIDDAGVRLSLYNNGGIAHYNALLAFYGADSLPPYFAFQDFTDYVAAEHVWVDSLEMGLIDALTFLGYDPSGVSAYLENVVVDFGDIIPVDFWN